WWDWLLAGATLLTVTAVLSVVIALVMTWRGPRSEGDEDRAMAWAFSWFVIGLIASRLSLFAWSGITGYLAIRSSGETQTQNVKSEVQGRIGDPDARADWDAIRRLEPNIVISGEDYICQVTRLEKVFGP